MTVNRAYGRLRLLVSAAFGATLLASPSNASPPCIDVALVLAVDGSSSVDTGEFELQRRGISAALQDPGVLATMKRAGDVAVAVVFWGGAEVTPQKIGWARIGNAVDARRVATRIDRLAREVKGSTALGLGLSTAIAMLRTAPFCYARAIVNLSGDGEETVMRRQSRVLPKPEDARNAAESDGITINALAITNAEHGLADYFRQRVITGPGAFVIQAPDYRTFADALRRKLIREIAPMAVSSLPPTRR